VKVEDSFKKYAKFLENLTIEDVPNLSNFATEDIVFVDPFHRVKGLKNMTQIFTNLFKKVSNIAFKIDDYAVRGSVVYYQWTLTGYLSGNPWRVVGITQLAFNKNNLITEQKEYWDAASQFYERIPIIGALLRYFRRRISNQ